MKEVSWLNMINAVFMYAALIIALIAMFVYLPGNGWEDVAQNITDSGNAWMLDIFGNKNLIIGFAIPTIFCTSMFQGVSQMGLQTCIAAKDVKSVKRSIGSQARSTVCSVSFRLCLVWQHWHLDIINWLATAR